MAIIANSSDFIIIIRQGTVVSIEEGIIKAVTLIIKKAFNSSNLDFIIIISRLIEGFKGFKGFMGFMGFMGFSEG